MNKKVLVLLPLLSLTLTACEKNIKQEEFVKQLDEVKATLASDDGRLKNIHINSNLNTEEYNYKEGEYYTYKMFALILIIPVTQGKYVWKEDGKFFYAETHTDSKKNVRKEITEEEFNTKMAQYKSTILAELQKPVSYAENLMGEHEGYAKVSNSYTYDSMNKTYRIVSNTENTQMNYDTSEEEVIKTKIVINFQKGLPVKYSTSGSSKSKWEYKYGKARLNVPSDNSNSESGN